MVIYLSYAEQCTLVQNQVQHGLSNNSLEAGLQRRTPVSQQQPSFFLPFSPLAKLGLGLGVGDRRKPVCV